MKSIRSLFYILTIFSILPTKAFAHGTEEEHQKELLIDNLLDYTSIFAIFLIVLFAVLIYFTRKKMQGTHVKTSEGRNRRKKLAQKNKYFIWLAIVSTIILVISLGMKGFTNGESESVSFPDIHGLAFTDNGQQLYVPAHDGIKVFENGSWSVADIEKNDYMGFSKVDDGFYSSGHPSPGSNRKNPLGVVKYTNTDEKLEPLDLYGEMDFHGMAVGYRSMLSMYSILNKIPKWMK